VVLGRLELGEEEVDVIVERTERWPTALVLAWLWLRTLEDPARAVRASKPNHPCETPVLSPSEQRTVECSETWLPATIG
jgi:hypothetical protein